VPNGTSGGTPQNFSHSRDASESLNRSDKLLVIRYSFRIGFFKITA
jgi:hypothetical protein